MNSIGAVTAYAKDVFDGLHRTLSSSQERIEATENNCLISKFLVQFNITHSGMTLGLSAYAALLRTAAVFNLIPSILATIMWIIAVIIAIIVYSVFMVRTVKYPFLTLHDLEDAYRTPFFVAPAIVATGLTASSPPKIRSTITIRTAFLVLLTYQCLFALFWYGRWLLHPGHSLRRVRATYFMATTDFFLLGSLGAIAGFGVIGRLALSVGILFWGIVLVAFFQFVGKTMAGQRPQPTMFLLIAPPSGIAIAHMQLQELAGRPVIDDFTLFFCAITLFLYCLLIRLFPMYWNTCFSASWWAYIFPLSTAANLATRIAYEKQILLMWIAAIFAASVTTLMITIVACLTILAAWKGNFPSDEAALSIQTNKELGKCDSEDYSEECIDVESQILEVIERLNKLEERRRRKDLKSEE